MLPPIVLPRIPAPTVEEFRRSYLGAGKPVVITGVADGWPALRSWSADSFVRRFGDVRVSAHPIKQGKIEADGGTGVNLGVLPMRECAGIIAKGSLEEGWLVTSPVEAFPPALKDEYSVPPYCAGGRLASSRVFISPAGMVTPLHQDLPENLYVMLKGKKRITLFAPSDPAYPHSRFSRLPNYARVDVERPDLALFPGFARAQPYTTDLAAGETLFIPSFWWHHLRHLEASLSLNFWWSRGWKIPIAWAGIAYARWRKLGDYSAAGLGPKVQ